MPITATNPRTTPVHGAIRRPATVVAGLLVGVLVAAGWSSAGGQEFENDMEMPMAPSAACGCRGGQTPPWHGNVAAAPGGMAMSHGGCGPRCGSGYGPPCGTMGSPCGAWWNRGMGYSLPPFFPRLSTFCREGYLPTPPPVALPRCHNCGVLIDAGF